MTAPSGHRRRGLQLPWRQLITSTATAVGVTVVVCLGAIAVGTDLHVGFFVLLAIAITGLVWVIRFVVAPAERLGIQPQVDVTHLQNRNADWRVRKLEEFLSGAQPRYAMTNTELRTAIVAIARSRIGEPERIIADAGRHPRLARYLSADPAPPLDRATVHLIIKELAAS